jgi:hypothetical protein
MALTRLWTPSSTCTWTRSGLWLAGLSAAALLVVARPAAAHPGCCVQCVNPHGEVIPPDGSAAPCDLGRLPTTNAANAGFNPDGFFQVGTRSTEGAACLSGTSDVELFSCDVVIVDGIPTCVDSSIIPIDDTFANGTLIKYTEANGVTTPTVTPMGSNNGSGNVNGGAVAFHIKASGDLLVCSVDGGGCELCLVPPPPK